MCEECTPRYRKIKKIFSAAAEMKVTEKQIIEGFDKVYGVNYDE